MRRGWIVVRVAGALAIGAAIVGQYVTSAAFWAQRGIDDRAATTVNFFSYFTIDSNVFAVVVLAGGAVVLARSDRRGLRASGVEPLAFGVIRGCVVSYMAVTGIVYNTLLRGIDVSEGAVLEWSNEILHVVGPVLLVVDWLVAPGRARLRYPHILAVVSFPLVWAAYTLLRGPTTPDPVAGRTGWYPYPFLDPRLAATGYVSVAGYVLLIAAIIAATGLAVIWSSRRPKPR